MGVTMEIFELTQLMEKRQHANRAFLEFLRVNSLSAGLYVLAAGSVDSQKPHREDEVYYVQSGRATIRVGAEDRPVEEATVIYVPAGVEHRFHTITQDLTILVFFAPAESS